MMGFIFDLLLILIVFIFVLVNYKRGIFRAFKPIRFVASLILAWTYKTEPNIFALIGKSLKLENLRTYTQTRVTDMWGAKINEVVANGVDNSENIFGLFGKFIPGIKEFFSEKLAQDVENLTNEVAVYVSDKVVSFVGQAAAFIAIFIVSYIVLWIITKILNVIFNHGPLRLVNRILGGAVGVCFGFVAAWVISLLLVNFAPMVVEGGLEGVLGGMGVLKWFYNSSPLSELFGVNPV